MSTPADNERSTNNTGNGTDGLERKPITPSPSDLSEHSSRDYCTTREVVFNYNLEDAPKGQKMLLLTEHYITVLGRLTGTPAKDKDIIAWSPMPVRDKKKEEELGL